MSRIVAQWLLLLIVLAGTGLRSYQLTERSLWFDEAFSWRLTQFSFSDVIARDARDVHPPLYYLVIKSWAVIFGSSLLALRSFSVTLAAATIALAYVFTAYAFSSRGLGLAAALAIAVAGFQIQFAWEARMYTLGTALALLTSWLLLHAVRAERPRFSWWAAYALGAAVFAYTHYYAFFSLAAHAVFVLAYLLIATRGRIGEILQWRTAWYALAAFALACLLFLPWLPSFLQQRAQVQESFWIPPLDRWSVPDTVYRMYRPTADAVAADGGWQTMRRTLPLLLTVLGLTILALLGWMRKKAARDGIWLVVLLTVLPVVLSTSLSILGGRSVYQDRFLLFAHVYLLIAAAVLLWQLPSRTARIIIGCAALAGLLAADVAYWNELDISHKPGAHAAAAYLFSQRQDNEPVFASSPFVFFPIDHYAHEEFQAPRTVKLISASSDIAHFAGAPILADNDTVDVRVLREATGAVWVVDTTGWGAEALSLPPDEWQVAAQERFLEVQWYQGEVVVTKYTRNNAR